MYLTPDELRELTGYIRPSKQCEQLDRMGIPHTEDRYGRPKVRRDYNVAVTRAQPDFSKVRV